jgi:hypothetical protein
MHAAVDEGVTFFDNAWEYGNGAAEEIMGKALAQDGSPVQAQEPGELDPVAVGVPVGPAARRRAGPLRRRCGLEGRGRRVHALRIL